MESDLGPMEFTAGKTVVDFMKLFSMKSCKHKMILQGIPVVTKFSSDVHAQDIKLVLQ